MYLKKLFVFLFFCGFWGSICQAFCGSDTLCCAVYFPKSDSIVNFSWRNNGSRLDSLLAGIRSRQKNAVLHRVSLISGSSPEGDSTFNKRLSDKRLASLRSSIQERFSAPDSVFVFSSLGEDWNSLSSLVEGSNMPYREETLRILRDIPVWVTQDGVVVDSRKRQLISLRGGRVWHYMEEHFFPELRSCMIKCELAPVGSKNDGTSIISQIEPADTVILRDTFETATVSCDTVQVPASFANTPKPFYMGLKTNLLYDALLVPNVGIEFYLGKGWSLGGNWMYAWWKNDKRHRYWRVYGGEIGLRKYLGLRSAGIPLAGHHIGIYGQMVTYDFEMGGRGYMGGRPGGTFWNKANYGVGLEYGYSLPVGRRLNLDFSLGLGYLGGTYYEYVPVDGHYVWEETKKRHWFGPTKAEVSLVWLLGRGNCKEKKGGKQ